MAAFNLSLPKLQIALNRAWVDSMYNTQFIANVAALRAQMQRQNVQLGKGITGTGKNAKQITQTIFWPVACTNETVACTDECLVATEVATDDSQDIVLSCLREAGFVESEKRFRVSPLAYEDVVAHQMLLKMKALDEYLNTQYIAFLEANKGDHDVYGATLTVGADNAGDWEIPESDWNVALIPEFLLAMELAKFSNPYILDGTNFFTQKATAMAYSANADGKGENNLFNQYDWVQDARSMVTAAPNKTYLINTNAVAFITGNFWDVTPVTRAATHKVWKVASKNLPGVYYDVHYQESCSSNDFVESWKFRVNGVFALNPLACDETNTGIFAFEKVAGI